MAEEPRLQAVSDGDGEDPEKTTILALDGRSGLGGGRGADLRVCETLRQ